MELKAGQEVVVEAGAQRWSARIKRVDVKKGRDVAYVAGYWGSECMFTFWGGKWRSADLNIDLSADPAGLPPLVPADQLDAVSTEA